MFPAAAAAAALAIAIAAEAAAVAVAAAAGRRLGTAVLAIAGHAILLLPAVLIVAVIVASNKLKMSLLKFRILIGSIVLIALFLGAGFIFRHQLSDVFTNLAQAKILSLNFDSAKIYLTMAKIINKNNPNYYFLAGNINFLENNFDDAIKNYNIAIGLGYQPEAYVLISRASAYLKINNYDSAISDYMTLFNQNPSDSFTVQRLAIAYMEADRGKDAVSVIERLIGEVESQKVSASDESKAGLYNLLGGAYYLDSNFKKAADAYNKSLKLIPNSLVATHLARALKNAGDIKGALEEINKVLADNPNYDPAVCALAGIYEKSGDYKKAIETATRALNKPIDSNNVSCLNYRGAAYFDSKDFVRAKEDFNKILESVHRLSLTGIDYRNLENSAKEMLAKIK